MSKNNLNKQENQNSDKLLNNNIYLHIFTTITLLFYRRVY